MASVPNLLHVDAQANGDKRRVSFVEKNDGVPGADFNFGDPPAKGRANSDINRGKAIQPQLQLLQPVSNSIRPGAVIFQKASGSARAPIRTDQKVLYQKAPPALNTRTGAFQIDSPEVQAAPQQHTKQQPLSNGVFLPQNTQPAQPTKSILKPTQPVLRISLRPDAVADEPNMEKAFIPSNFESYSSSVDNRPSRNVGPTPQIMADIGPRRFWLPPNAPVTEVIPGPWLPYFQGVPNGTPFNPAIPNFDAYSPRIQGLTGPRDVPVIVDPPAFGLTPPADVPYQQPCELLPLNPITPIPGGNIIDPLSPQVNNVHGVYFPEEPYQNGAYQLTDDIPPAQVIAQNIDDGAYMVEPVIDPIVFFDPQINQTLVFDPIRDYTRLYNPETDPELGVDLQVQSQLSALQDEIGSSEMLQKAAKRASSITKHTQLTKPAFWIIRKQENQETLEKSGAVRPRKSIGGIYKVYNGTHAIVTDPVLESNTLYNSHVTQKSTQNINSKPLHHQQNSNNNNVNSNGSTRPPNPGVNTQEKRNTAAQISLPASLNQTPPQADESRSKQKTVSFARPNPQEPLRRQQPSRPSREQEQNNHRPKNPSMNIKQRYRGVKAASSDATSIKANLMAVKVFLTVLVAIYII